MDIEVVAWGEMDDLRNEAGEEGERVLEGGGRGGGRDRAASQGDQQRPQHAQHGRICSHLNDAK